MVQRRREREERERERERERWEKVGRQELGLQHPQKSVAV
jgi:hypothetical protein